VALDLIKIMSFSTVPYNLLPKMTLKFSLYIDLLLSSETMGFL
jgi:hypothetical protein